VGDKPIVLFTNDDGIGSPGLWAAAEAFADLAELLVVAPRGQQSGMGRSLPVASEGRIYEEKRTFTGVEHTVYAVDGTPAQAVQHGVIELAPRLPSLVVSGINYGENTGNGVTISGTVGAALEAASLGIPALAVSQQTRIDLHLTYADVDCSRLTCRSTRPLKRRGRSRGFRGGVSIGRLARSVSPYGMSGDLATNSEMIQVRRNRIQTLTSCCTQEWSP
jgi:broad specificity polyphosphatase/5'/3'-nucleotidase SurE